MVLLPSHIALTLYLLQVLLPISKGKPAEGGPKKMSDQSLMERCIKECLVCVDIASRCANECLVSEQVSSMERCIRLCLDCADLTAACARMMGRGSEFSTQVCGVCADVCEACAGECEKYDGDLMRRCAETCRRCAETCRRMQAA
jgi:hypothetical protein